MTLQQRWQAALEDLPLVAILRGVRPSEVVQIGESLLQSGFRIIEIPLNSPNAFESIRKLVAALGSHAIVGAGTVIELLEVEQLASVGGELCVSPNTNGEIIRRTKAAGMISVPGVLTPTDAFTAITAGADALKLFPAEMSGPAGLRALRTVVPAGMRVFPVGGVGLPNLRAYLEAGAAGAGFGSSLFAPGDSAEVVRKKAAALADAWREAALHAGHPAVVQSLSVSPS